MQVAEIAVRLGDSPLAVTQLASGTYRIGTAAGVDLAVEIPGLTTFPLVEHTQAGVVVRIPVGIVARRDGAIVDGRIALARGDRIEVELGRVGIEIALGDPSQRLARPAIECAFAQWFVAALVLHVAVLGLADVLAEPPKTEIALWGRILRQLPDPPREQQPREARRVPASLRRARVAAAPVPQITESPARPSSEAMRRDRAVASSRRAGILGSSKIAGAISAIVGTKDIAKELSDVGPIYREDEVAQQRGAFGTGRHYEGAPSVPVGRYATVATGRAAGDHYALPGEVGRKDPPRAELCTGTCTIAGGLSRDAVHTAIAARRTELTGCYERHGGGVTGEVVADFTVDGGKVIAMDASGLGSTGGCVGAVLRRTKFPRAAASTVRYPITFTP